jgi:hypothetical protein
MAISRVVVVDGNNLIVRIDRGVAGRGVTDVDIVESSGSIYLVFTFSDGTTETVGPVGTIAYVGQSPIVVNASTISLSTVPVNLGGTGQITANAGFNALAPTQTGNTGKYLKTDGTNSAWDLLDISTADITGVLPIANGGTNASTISAARTNLGLGTIATQNANAIAITGGTITGITDLAVADGGTGSSTAAGAMVNLLPSYTGNANKRLGLDGTATGLEWVTDGGGTVTSIDVSGGTTGMSFTGGPVTTSGTITLSGTLDLDNGGTGATTASGARTNLNAADQATTISAGTGLSGGGDLSANRTLSIANTAVTAAAYGSASNTLTATVNAQGQLTALAATPIAIANTQISGLGTMSTQNANAVAITGGSITGITDLAVADGGTGASDAAGARTNLNAADQATTITAGTGLSGGGNLSANRTIDIANTTVTAGAFGSASNTLTATVNAQGQLTALAATPIAIANTQVSGLGTMSTQNSNAVTITGGSITGITDLALADGGTGASNAPDARSNLGLGSAAVLNAGVALGVATLDAGGTVPLSQIPASIQGGVSYQGAWNASTNTPTLVSSVGSKGYYYVVSVAGNTNLNGVTDWLVGDWAIFNGTAWEKIDNTDQVASVNGYTGVVVLSNTDVGAPPTSLTISAGTGLSGGGSLAANRTISIANTTVTAAPYGTASAVPTFTVNGQGQLTAASDVTIAIANTQVSGLGTMSTQNANSVAITGGSITGITDLAIADGGTGASTAADARTNLSAAYNAITISAGTGLTGGGDLTANRTLAIDSSVVTLTGTQTLTNKTLTSPLVNEILDTNGNEILGLSPTASATDFVTVKNGIGTGVPLHIYADGPSANIGLHLQPKGTGLITISDGTDFNKGIRFRSSGSAASAVTLLDAVATAGRVVTLPDATTTLVGRDTTDTLTNKTIAFGSNTFSGSLAIANGGTGQATANAAFNALAPSQTGNSGKYLTTDGTDTSWASNPLGTVTSVGGTGTVSGISLSGTVITSGNLTLGGALDLSAYNGAGAFTTLSATGTIFSTQNNAFFTATPATATSAGYIVTVNTGGAYYIGVNNSDGTTLGGTAYSLNLTAPASRVIENYIGATKVLAISSTGIAVTGTLSNTLDATIYGLTVGRGAGALSTNAVLGFSALSGSNTGNNNIAIGYESLKINTSGAQNIAVGRSALIGNLTGAGNVVMGVGAMLTNSSGSNNVAIGSDALYVNNASNNTAVGYQAGYSSTGGEVTFIGSEAGKSNTGNYNTSVGYASLTASGAGSYNAALGRSALAANTSGNYNVAMGMQALVANTSASQNTAVGYQALYANETLPELTAVGYRAGFRATAGYSTFIGHGAGVNQSTGDSNTYIGRGITSNAATGASTGSTNTVVGNYALAALTSGSNNVAIGQTALYLNNSGGNNTAVGADTLRTNTTGINNTVVGYQAGYVGNGSQNTFVGVYSGALSTGSGNTGVGYNALQTQTAGSTGANNTAVGTDALQANTTGASNTAVGYRAAYNTTTDYSTVAIGHSALYENTSGGGGSYNIAIGQSAHYYGNSDAYYNIAVGAAAMRGNSNAKSAKYNTAIGNPMTPLNTGSYVMGEITSGSYNVALGNAALGFLTSGSYNVAIGVSALRNNATGTGNVAIGHQANFTNSGNYSYIVAVGYQALYYGGGGQQTAVGTNALANANVSSGGDTAVGYNSLASLGSGYYNTAVGTSSLSGTNSGAFNTAVGYSAASANTSGINLTAIGYQALSSTVTAGNATAVGYRALQSLSTQNGCTAVGLDAARLTTTGYYIDAFGGQALAANTTGYQNSAFGQDSLKTNTSGTNNAAFGYQAGYSILTGSNNTLIGKAAGILLSSGGDNTIVGTGGTPNLTTGYGNVTLGDIAAISTRLFNITTQNDRLVMGHVNIVAAYVQTAWTVVSDLRDKVVLGDVPLGLDFVRKLKPIKYQFKENRESNTTRGAVKYGFGAQDVLAEEGDNPVIVDTEQPEKLKITDSHMMPVFANAIKEMADMIDQLKAEIAELKGKL